MATHSIITIVCLLLLAQASQQTASCYFPDGTFAEFDSPCFPDQPASICCGQGHTCMSNSLCRWPDSEMPYPLAYIRGSCTDSTWNSTACGNVCKTVFPSAWDPIIACPGAEFCCELDSNDPSGCCKLTNTTAHPLYQLGSATTVTVIGSSSPTAVPSVTTVISTVSGGSQTTSAPISPNSNNNNGGGSGSGAKIGIGVGVGGGVILILASLAFFLFLRKRRISDTQPPLDNVQDTGMGKSELPAESAPAPSYYEQSNVPMGDGYKKDGDVTVSSHLTAAHRMSEMP